MHFVQKSAAGGIAFTELGLMLHIDLCHRAHQYPLFNCPPIPSSRFSNNSNLHCTDWFPNTTARVTSKARMHSCENSVLHAQKASSGLHQLRGLLYFPLNKTDGEGEDTGLQSARTHAVARLMNTTSER